MPTARIGQAAAAGAGTPATLLGINLAGGAAGASVLPGAEGIHYHFASAADVAYAASQGARIARIDFLWERVQPRLGGPLDQAQLDRLIKVAEAAGARSVGILWNMHNYGRRTVNGRTHIIGADDGVAPRAAFAECWELLAAALRPGLVKATYAYGLMNEPHDMPAVGHWAASAQVAVDAIVAVDPGTLIYVAGDGWSSAKSWRETNEHLRIRHPDPGLIVYEAHQYCDPRSRYAGTYRPRNYDAQGLVEQAYSDLLRPFTDWLTERSFRGAIGECGVPDSDSRWTRALEHFLRSGMEAGLVSMLLWAHAPFFGEDYELQLAPTPNGPRRAVSMFRELALGAGASTR